jgi:hypothetical protein
MRWPLGLSGAKKARSVPVETLCRIESGKATPTIASVEKMDRALKAAEPKSPGTRKRKR